MKRKNKILQRLILCILFIGLFTINNNYVQAEELEVVYKSKAFEAWENLSEEERKTAIQPLYQDITIKDSIKRSSYNILLSSNPTTEKKYTLKDNLNSIIVKNQEKTGSCWAFSFSSVLETSVANQYNKTAKEYSPIHMDYVASNMFNKKLGEGGNAFLAIAYSLNERGPVYENDFKFQDVYDENNNSKDTYYLTEPEKLDLNKTARARIEDATFFANIYKSYTDTSVTYKNSNAIFGAEQYDEEEVQSIRNLIKEHIKEKGAVTAMFYSDMGITAEGTHESKGGYYNYQAKAFYCNGSSFSIIPNHAVTIIGWDDEFSKDNFSEGHKPLNDGAYIVLNSWGTEFGDNGYFYVSYDDACIEQSIIGVDSIKEYTENNQSYYDYMYQYDELGVTQAFYMVNDEQTKYLTSVYAANVYTRQNTEKTEYLNEVGIYLYSTEGVEIYLNPADDNLNNTELVASYTGTNALEAGYHTLKLSSPIELTGNKFVLKIKYINAEKAQLPVECNWVDSGLTTTSNMYDKVVSNPGESYISKDGTTWSDMYNYKLTDKYILKNTNACIKAFTVEGSNKPSEIEVEKIELNKYTATIKEGETLTLVATVLPENATNKNIIWTSSNEDVASVDNGSVMGKSVGTSVITAKSYNGKITKSCTVTVNAKNQDTEVVEVTAVNLNKDKATIKKGETLTLVATVLPENATNKNIIWTSSNEDVASVNEGVVSGKKAGEATITVKTENGKYSNSCIVTVEEDSNNNNDIIKVNGVSLDKTTLKMQIGDKTNLVATIKPMDATNKNVTWTSSNEKVATISENGIITAVAEGNTKITVTTDDGDFSATCDLTVTKKTNTDDDIYADSGKDSQNDESIANKEIPYTGTKLVIFIIVVGILSTALIYIKYRTYKDIK